MVVLFTVNIYDSNTVFEFGPFPNKDYPTKKLA